MNLSLEQIALSLKGEEIGANEGYQICGGSMIPCLWPFDRLCITKQEKYEVGDIVIFKNEDTEKYYLQRIVKIVDGALAVCADNSTKVTYPVYSCYAYGKVVAYRHLKKNKKLHTCSSFTYKLYVKIWSVFWIRKLLLPIFEYFLMKEKRKSNKLKVKNERNNRVRKQLHNKYSSKQSDEEETTK